MPLVTDLVVRWHEKVVIWCLFPAQQVNVTAVLRLAEIDAHILSADLTNSERENLVRSFTKDPESAMVLVCSYNVNSTGLNLQYLCSNVILFDLPNLETIRTQAIGRVRRLGQRRVVHVYEIRVRNSFNICELTANISKAVPSIVADLNSKIFHVGEADSGKNFDLGEWAKLSNGQLVKRGDPAAEGIPENEWMKGRDVVVEMMKAMHGEVLQVDTAVSYDHSLKPLPDTDWVYTGELGKSAATVGFQDGWSEKDRETVRR